VRNAVLQVRIIGGCGGGGGGGADDGVAIKAEMICGRGRGAGSVYSISCDDLI
jgi:hypothetical protein